MPMKLASVSDNRLEKCVITFSFSQPSPAKASISGNAELTRVCEENQLALRASLANPQRCSYKNVPTKSKRFSLRNSSADGPTMHSSHWTAAFLLFSGILVLMVLILEETFGVSQDKSLHKQSRPFPGAWHPQLHRKPS